MTARRSLRRHVLLGLLVYAAILSAVVAIHGIWVNERTERAVWESMLRTELDYIAERLAQDPNFKAPDSDLLRLYRAGEFPPHLQGLEPGLHDELQIGKRQYVVLVDGRGSRAQALALDITDQESDEAALAGSLLASVVIVAALLAALTFWGVERLFRPLKSLAATIPLLQPDGRGPPLAIQDSDPAEVAVLAGSLNQYMDRIRDHIDRERTFINLASHELRTPIAVVAGSMEVALSHPDTTDSLQPHLLRAQRTCAGMEELTEMLLALARDPERSLRDLEPVDLASELTGIVEDFSYVARNKELTITLHAARMPNVRAPAQVLRAVIGNLLRNAIENSDRGEIHLRPSGEHGVEVEDTGHGMSAAEMSELHSRIARTGHTSTGGLGLGLIGRICEHYRWRLSIDSTEGGGTRARIHFL